MTEYIFSYGLSNFTNAVDTFSLQEFIINDIKITSPLLRIDSNSTSVFLVFSADLTNIELVELRDVIIPAYNTETTRMLVQTKCSELCNLSIDTSVLADTWTTVYTHLYSGCLSLSKNFIYIMYTAAAFGNTTNFSIRIRNVTNFDGIICSVSSTNLNINEIQTSGYNIFVNSPSDQSILAIDIKKNDGNTTSGVHINSLIIFI